MTTYFTTYILRFYFGLPSFCETKYFQLISFCNAPIVIFYHYYRSVVCIRVTVATSDNSFGSNRHFWHLFPLCKCVLSGLSLLCGGCLRKTIRITIYELLEQDTDHIYCKPHTCQNAQKAFSLFIADDLCDSLFSSVGSVIAATSDCGPMPAS